MPGRTGLPSERMPRRGAAAWARSAASARERAHRSVHPLFHRWLGWALPWLPLFLVLIVGLGVLVAVVFARKRRLLLPTAS